MATLRQKKAVEILSDSIGKSKNKKLPTKGQILTKAGYAKQVAKTPELVFNSKGFKEELAPVVDQLKKERQRAIDYLKRKISTARYRDLTDNIDKLTKNIQLLEGKETEIKKVYKWQDYE